MQNEEGFTGDCDGVGEWGELEKLFADLPVLSCIADLPGLVDVSSPLGAPAGAIAVPEVKLRSCIKCTDSLVPGVLGNLCWYCFALNALDATSSIDTLLFEYVHGMVRPECVRYVTGESPVQMLRACCTDATCPAGMCQLMREVMKHTAHPRDTIQAVYSEARVLGGGDKLIAAEITRQHHQKKAKLKCELHRRQACDQCQVNDAQFKVVSQSSKFNNSDWQWLQPLQQQLGMFNGDAAFTEWFTCQLGKGVGMAGRSTKLEAQVCMYLRWPVDFARMLIMCVS